MAAAGCWLSFGRIRGGRGGRPTRGCWSGSASRREQYSQPPSRRASFRWPTMTPSESSSPPSPMSRWKDRSRSRGTHLANPQKDAEYMRPEVDPIIWEHGRRNMALQQAGLMPIVCPVRDEGEYSGTAILTVPVDRTRRSTAKTPAQGGRPHVRGAPGGWFLPLSPTDGNIRWWCPEPNVVTLLAG